MNGRNPDDEIPEYNEDEGRDRWLEEEYERNTRRDMYGNIVRDSGILDNRIKRPTITSDTINGKPILPKGKESVDKEEIAVEGYEYGYDPEDDEDDGSDFSDEGR